MKYRLLKDCPHGKAGSVWERVNWSHDLTEAEMRYVHDLQNLQKEYRYWFPVSTFYDWFEEIKEMPKFTKEQRYALEDFIKNNVVVHGTNGPLVSEYDLKRWLDENTLS